MSRAATFVTGRRAVLGGCILAFAGMGCDPATLWYIAGGPGDKQPADYPLPPKDGKRDVTVAILASAVPTLGVEFTGVERELADLLAKKLAAETAREPHKIKVIDQTAVDKFQATHPNWRTMAAGQMAKPLGADYVLDVSVTAVSMYDPNFGREVYSGKGTVSVAVFDAATPDKPVREYIHNSTPLAKNSDTPAGQYRQFLLDRLATELAYRHVAHMPSRQLGPLK